MIAKTKRYLALCVALIMAAGGLTLAPRGGGGHGGGGHGGGGHMGGHMGGGRAFHGGGGGSFHRGGGRMGGGRAFHRGGINRGARFRGGRGVRAGAFRGRFRGRGFNRGFRRGFNRGFRRGNRIFFNGFWWPLWYFDAYGYPLYPLSYYTVDTYAYPTTSYTTVYQQDNTVYGRCVNLCINRLGADEPSCQDFCSNLLE
jgi:hypothetical protein